MCTHIHTHPLQLHLFLHLAVSTKPLLHSRTSPGRIVTAVNQQVARPWPAHYREQF